MLRRKKDEGDGSGDDDECSDDPESKCITSPRVLSSFYHFSFDH